MARTPIIAGNWKMNKGTVDEAVSLVGELKAALNSGTTAEVVVCPPYPVLAAVGEALLGSGIALGAQDVFWKATGAYTGQVSAPMLAALGVRYVILGHSEARGRFGVAEPDFDEDILRHFGETDASVNRKVRATLEAGMTPILCVGETLAEREADTTDSVIEAQLTGGLAGLTPEQVSDLVLAYEPVWAIGTGKTCDSSEADRVCGMIRATVGRLFSDTAAASVRIQYGGSMKPENAVELLGKPEIDGGLVGGASLKAADFAAIVGATAAGQ